MPATNTAPADVGSAAGAGGEGGGAAGLDQVAAGDGHRRPDPLLVAGQEDGDIGILQRARRLHGAQGGDDDRDPALVVADAGAGRAHPCALEPLEGVVGLEDGVEVADQQHVAARTLMGGDQMAGAAGFSHVDPADREAQRLQLGPDHVADDANAGQVQGAAVLVHHPLQQGDVAVILGGDCPDHGLFGAVDYRCGGRLREGGAGEGEEEQGGKDQAHRGSRSGRTIPTGEQSAGGRSSGLERR